MPWFSCVLKTQSFKKHSLHFFKGTSLWSKVSELKCIQVPSMPFFTWVSGFFFSPLERRLLLIYSYVCLLGMQICKIFFLHHASIYWLNSKSLDFSLFLWLFSFRCIFPSHKSVCADKTTLCMKARNVYYCMFFLCVSLENCQAHLLWSGFWVFHWTVFCFWWHQWILSCWFQWQWHWARREQNTWRCWNCAYKLGTSNHQKIPQVNQCWHFLFFFPFQEKKIFQIPWMHAARHGWDVEKDAPLFRNWAIHTGIGTLFLQDRFSHCLPF